VIQSADIDPPDLLALPSGARVLEFEIERVIGRGGFSIVYLAFDHSLLRRVALKEYLPDTLARRDATLTVTPFSAKHRESFDMGLQSFLQEARLLARFDHPSLVKVFRFWEASGTAYMAMTYYEGPTLRETFRDGSRLAPDIVQRVTARLLEAVESLHAAQCLHRDIAPDNVILQRDGNPVLLDFGAARRFLNDKTQALTVILKTGYAPIEQYSDDGSMEQGPWTDVYALAATLYAVITGKGPPACVSRVFNDPYVPLARLAPPGYPPQFIAGIDQALAFLPERRPRSIPEFRRALGIDAPADADERTIRLESKPANVSAAIAAARSAARVAPTPIESGSKPFPRELLSSARGPERTGPETKPVSTRQPMAPPTSKSSASPASSSTVADTAPPPTTPTAAANLVAPPTTNAPPGPPALTPRDVPPVAKVGPLPESKPPPAAFARVNPLAPLPADLSQKLASYGTSSPTQVTETAPAAEGEPFPPVAAPGNAPPPPSGVNASLDARSPPSPTGFVRVNPLAPLPADLSQRPVSTHAPGSVPINEERPAISPAVLGAQVAETQPAVTELEVTESSSPQPLRRWVTPTRARYIAGISVLAALTLAVLYWGAVEESPQLIAHDRTDVGSTSPEAMHPPSPVEVPPLPSESATPRENRDQERTPPSAAAPSSNTAPSPTERVTTPAPPAAKGAPAPRQPASAPQNPLLKEQPSAQAGSSTPATKDTARPLERATETKRETTLPAQQSPPTSKDVPSAKPPAPIGAKEDPSPPSITSPVAGAKGMSSTEDKSPPGATSPTVVASIEPPGRVATPAPEVRSESKNRPQQQLPINAERPVDSQSQAKAADPWTKGREFELGQAGVAVNLAEAANWYRRGADEGDPRAQNSLGFAYQNGRGVPVDYAAARRWFEAAAAQGNPAAQNNLGNLYSTGLGVARNDITALSWYRKSADQGYALAQNNLGLMLENGRGVFRDPTAAAELYRRAAESGNMNAMYNLARLYEAGLGVPKSPPDALKWFQAAADKGQKSAIAKLAEFQAGRR